MFTLFTERVLGVLAHLQHLWLHFSWESHFCSNHCSLPWAEIGFSLNWKVFQNILFGHPSMILLGHQGTILFGHLVQSLSFSSSGRLPFFLLFLPFFSFFLFSLTWTQPASNLSETLQYIQTISITGFRFFSNLS